MVKSEGAQRESDGVVVPQIVARNAAGGKGPGFDHAWEEGKHQGMTGRPRSNNPGRQEPAELVGSAPIGTVRRLQRKLWAAAKQSSDRRFHALYPYDRIYTDDILWEEWERVPWHHPLSEDRVTMSRGSSVSRVRKGAADNAAIQLVRVQPCQLSVSDMKRRHRLDRVTGRVLRSVKGLAAAPDGSAVGAIWRLSEHRNPKVIE